MAPLLPESASPGDILSRLAQSAPAHVRPTRTTLSEVASRVLPRQATTTTTTVVSADGGGPRPLSGGAIAGIVIGSIAGFLLLLWLLRSCTNLRQAEWWGRTFEPEHEKPHHHHRHHSHHASYPYRRETHRSRSRHSRHSHSRSPRPSVGVVYYENDPRGRSPRPPPPVYPARDLLDGRDLRMSSGSRRHRY